MLVESLREIILKTNDGFEEKLKWGMLNDSLNAQVCYIQKSKTHVSIGFQYGALLNDSKGHLQGAGKEMRHIKFSLSDTVDAALVKELIEEAIRYDAEKVKLGLLLHSNG
ncbi:MAG: DUF1801 domain-containing protein [Oleispira sp.]|nr:DUF1801 domain-containing protein [Oleispira sp.]